MNAERPVVRGAAGCAGLVSTSCNDQRGRRWRTPVLTAAALVGMSMIAGSAMAAPPAGEQLYMTRACALCHAGDARGVIGMYPPLPESVRRFGATPLGRRYLVAVITYGTVGTINVDGHAYTGYMPEHPAGFLGDRDLAVLINWLATLDAAPPAKFKPFTADSVRADRTRELSHAEVLRLRAEAVRSLPAR